MIRPLESIEKRIETRTETEAGTHDSPQDSPLCFCYLQLTVARRTDKGFTNTAGAGTDCFGAHKSRRSLDSRCLTWSILDYLLATNSIFPVTYCSSSRPEGVSLFAIPHPLGLLPVTPQGHSLLHYSQGCLGKEGTDVKTT
jgi:hypothetical protein